VERIRGHDAGELLSMALDWLPASVATRLGFVHFFIGDPVFAGLHEFEVADDGVPTGPLPRRVGVLPEPPTEVGAARDHRVAVWARSNGNGCPRAGACPRRSLEHEWSAKPVSDYARADRFEAFAEAFTAWVGLPSYQAERDRLYRIDRESAAFFDAISLQM
jgi:hypothetical protein